MQSSVNTKRTWRAIYTFKKKRMSVINHNSDISSPNWGIDNMACYDETVLKTRKKAWNIQLTQE